MRGSPSPPVFPNEMPESTKDALPSQRDVAERLYKPLKSWQTRIILLEPGTFVDPLKCELVTVDMIPYEGVVLHEKEELVAYEALSYCWGNPELCTSIECNGLSYPVTLSLGSALRHLRLLQGIRYLWVDAICINQFDTDEKSEQVRRMLSVYKKARRVVAWLGDRAEHSDLALQFLNSFSDDSRTQQDLDSFSRIHSEECYAYQRELYDGLRELYLRSWFRRTWV